MTNILLLVSVVIILCIILNKLSSKAGMPMLLAFIVLGMLFGSDGIEGCQHSVFEILSNSIDEAREGYGRKITVTRYSDGSYEIEDHGRGIPVGKHAKTGISTVETVYTVLHAGGKFGGGGYKVSGGLHGVGASVVNALSKWMEVNIKKDKEEYITL